MQDGQWTKGDIVKTMDSTVSYSAQQQRWIGTLKRFNNKEMYWVKSSVAQQLPISGILIDTCTLSIKANQWNAISYLPHLNLPEQQLLPTTRPQQFML